MRAYEGRPGCCLYTPICGGARLQSRPGMCDAATGQGGNCLNDFLFRTLQTRVLPVFRKSHIRAPVKAYKTALISSAKGASTDLARKSATIRAPSSAYGMFRSDDSRTRRYRCHTHCIFRTPQNYVLAGPRADSLPRYNNSNPLASCISKKPNLRTMAKADSPDVKGWFYKKGPDAVVVRSAPRTGWALNVIVLKVQVKRDSDRIPIEDR